MSNPAEPQQKQEQPAAREPYEPPAIVSEEVFETLAAVCGRVSGPRCAFNGGNQS